MSAASWKKNWRTDLVQQCQELPAYSSGHRLPPVFCMNLQLWDRMSVIISLERGCRLPQRSDSDTAEERVSNANEGDKKSYLNC